MLAQRIVDVEQFIDDRPFGAFQWLVLAFCFFIISVDGLNTAIVGFIAPSLMKEWGASRAALGSVVSAALFGLAVGALCSGPIADRVGRRLVIIVSVLLFGCTCLISSMAFSLSSMTVLRFITGLGLGAALPNAVTLINEYSPRRKRLFFGTLTMCGFTLGSAMAGFVSAKLIPAYGWRSVLIFGGVMPLAIVPLLIMFLPESARFLVHRHAPAARIAALLNRLGQDSELEAATFRMPETAIRGATHSIASLFADRKGVGTILLWLIYFLSLFVVYLLTGWLPLMMQESGVSIANSAVVTGMFMFGSTFGTVLIGWLMDKAKKYLVLACFYAIATIAIAVTAFHPNDVPLLRWIVFVSGVGMGAVTSMPAFAADFYDIRCRATGVSWMLGIGRFGGILGAGIGGTLLTIGWTFQDIFFGLSIPTLLAAATVGAMGFHYARMPTHFDKILGSA